MPLTWYELAAGPTPWAGESSTYTAYSYTVVGGGSFYATDSHHAFDGYYSAGNTGSSTRNDSGPTSAIIRLYSHEASNSWNGMGIGSGTDSGTQYQSYSDTTNTQTSTESQSGMSSYNVVGDSFTLEEYATVEYAQGATGTANTGAGTFTTSSTTSSSYTLSYTSGSGVMITDLYASSTYSETVNSWIATTGIYSRSRSIVTVVTLTSGTFTYLTTGTTSTTGTVKDVSYVLSACTYPEYTYGTSTRGSGHLLHVVEALPTEVLYIRTATNSILGSFGMGLSPSFTRSTLSHVTEFVITGGASPMPSHTVNFVYNSISFGTETLASQTTATVTLQSFKGDLPPAASDTYTVEIYGATTFTQDCVVRDTYTTSYIGIGFVLTSSWNILEYDAVINTTVLGIDSNASATTYSLEYRTVRTEYFSYDVWDGQTAETKTIRYSPAGIYETNEFNGNYYYIYDTAFSGYDVVPNIYEAYATLNRRSPIKGFQSPSDIGSGGLQGRGITANQSFFIGSENVATGEQVSMLVPFPYKTSTAEKGGTRYSFSVDDVHVWHVTQAAGTTSTDFTATVGLVSQSAIYGNSNPYFTYAFCGVSDIHVVYGGGYISPNTEQVITFVGRGFRYTLGDASSYTTVSTIFAESYNTLNIGSKHIAVDTFLVNIGSPYYYAGLPQVISYPYSKA